MFLKKSQSHTHKLTISNGMNMSLPPQRLNYKVFPMKTSEAFQIWTKFVDNKWKGNQVPLGEINFDFTLTKEPQNYISHFV